MYLFGEADDRDYEADLAGFGRIFPHAYGQADDRYFTTKLTLSPAGDELTLDFGLCEDANGEGAAWSGYGTGLSRHQLFFQ
jgi:hypothetical protein